LHQVLRRPRERADRLRASVLRAVPLLTRGVRKRGLGPSENCFRGPTRSAIDAPTMPQKPQARAKDKKRLAKRLANWRKKQELASQPHEPAKTATKG